MSVEENKTNPLKDFFSNNDITQTRFAKTIGVSQGLIGQWLRNERPISVAKSLEIENAFKIDAALAIIRGQRGKHQEFVFTYEGKPVKGCNNHAWQKALKRAEIENFRWHDLRHTWASWHIQNGTPLHILQELGGWSGYDMVKRYAHLSSEHLSQFAGNVKVVTKVLHFKIGSEKK